MPHQIDEGFITYKVIDFLDDYDIYHNPHAVQISYNANNAIMLAVNWAESAVNPDFDVETFVYAMPLSEFIRTFNIREANDLKRIRPGALTRLYEEGRAEIGCIIVRQQDCYCMQYQIVNNVLMAKCMQT